MGQKRNKLILEVVQGDKTFHLTYHKNQEAWCGKCIHCKTKLYVSTAGKCLGKTTLEHIIPKNHGGTDEVSNLALACKSCNNHKGVHHDKRRLDDPKLQKMIKMLLERKAERLQ